MENENNKAEFENWLVKNEIQDVEVVVSDFAGLGRGKIMPTKKFIGSMESGDLKLPESTFSLSMDCDFIGNEFISDLEEDLFLLPDINTLCVVPWRKHKTATVICDLVDEKGETSTMAPRQMLKNVLKLYAEKGWRPIVAPEFEFFLIANNGEYENDPTPPTGRSGKPHGDKGVYSIDGPDDFSHLFDDVYAYSGVMGVPIDTITQEAGPGQFEVNMNHGDALDVADQAFNFKRLLKQAAIKHGTFATFMAKPYPKEFGSAMHVHQSIVDANDGSNIFADENAKNTPIFLSHIAGLQQYLPDMMLLLAPYNNSFLRFGSALSSPVNLHWGVENRSVGLRVPSGESRAARRIENRIAGSDVNPYLLITASLLAGYLGMIKDLKPSEPLVDSAYDLETYKIPDNFYMALSNLDNSTIIREYLGDPFVTTYLDVKKNENTANSQTLTKWEISKLLVNV